MNREGALKVCKTTPWQKLHAKLWIVFLLTKFFFVYFTFLYFSREESLSVSDDSSADIPGSERVAT